jgi:carbonic anhydrase
LRKDVSFLNKAIIKRKLEEVPENSYVYIDTTRADFIDRDVVETIEDFMIAAPLKNIEVELKKSKVKDQGFHSLLIEEENNGQRIIREHDTDLAKLAN